MLDVARTGTQTRDEETQRDVGADAARVQVDSARTCAPPPPHAAPVAVPAHNFEPGSNQDTTERNSPSACFSIVVVADAAGGAAVLRNGVDSALVALFIATRSELALMEETHLGCGAPR